MPLNLNIAKNLKAIASSFDGSTPARSREENLRLLREAMAANPNHPRAASIRQFLANMEEWEQKELKTRQYLREHFAEKNDSNSG